MTGAVGTVVGSFGVTVVPFSMEVEPEEAPVTPELAVVDSDPDVLKSGSTVVPEPSVVEPELARVVIVPCSPEGVEVGSVMESSDLFVVFSPATDGSMPDRRGGLVVAPEFPDSDDVVDEPLGWLTGLEVEMPK